MEDSMPHISEYRPYWRHVDDGPYPKNAKCLWKTDRGQAVIGVYYSGCCWSWWAPLPKHSPEDKERMRGAK